VIRAPCEAQQRGGRSSGEARWHAEAERGRTDMNRRAHRKRASDKVRRVAGVVRGNASRRSGCAVGTEAVPGMPEAEIPGRHCRTRSPPCTTAIGARAAAHGGVVADKLGCQRRAGRRMYRPRYCISLDRGSRAVLFFFYGDGLPTRAGCAGKEQAFACRPCFEAASWRPDRTDACRIPGEASFGVRWA